jgi:uncharacterized membrane protein
MAHDLKLFFAILPLFLMLDYLWLGRIMQRFYLGELGDLARREGETMKPRLLAAAGVYLALPGGIVLFALPRVDPAVPLASGLWWGFLYGVVVYAVYDLTNRATLDHWPVRLVLVDIGWGGFLCAFVTAAGSLLGTVIR